MLCQPSGDSSNMPEILKICYCGIPVTGLFLFLQRSIMNIEAYVVYIPKHQNSSNDM